MRVTVKALDIGRGGQGNPWTCAVTRAVRRAYRNIGRWPGYLCVDGTMVSVGKNEDETTEQYLPARVSDFIDAFDVSKKAALALTPLKFQIRA